MFISLFIRSFPGGTSGKEPACQCRRHKRHGFSPWVGKIPQRRSWQPTPVFLPGDSHEQMEPDRLHIESQRVGMRQSSRILITSIKSIHLCYIPLVRSMSQIPLTLKGIGLYNCVVIRAEDVGTISAFCFPRIAQCNV